MGTLAHVVALIVGLFHAHGAIHAAHAQDGSNAWIASRHYLVAVCRIPDHFAGTFHCAGWVKRP